MSIHVRNIPCEETRCSSTRCFDSREANMLTVMARTGRRSSVAGSSGGGSRLPPSGALGDIVWFRARGELWRGGNICCPRARQTVMDGQVCCAKCVKVCAASALCSGTQKDMHSACASHTRVELAMGDASAPDDDLVFFQFTGASFFFVIASEHNATGVGKVLLLRWKCKNTKNKKRGLK